MENRRNKKRCKASHSTPAGEPACEQRVHANAAEQQNACDEIATQQTNEKLGTTSHEAIAPAPAATAAASGKSDKWLVFDGDIRYCGTLAEVEAAANELIELVESKPRTLLIGFDMEWEYMPEDKPPALMQLCVRVPQQPAAADAGCVQQQAQLERQEGELQQQPEQPGPQPSAPAKQGNKQEKSRKRKDRAADDCPPAQPSEPQQTAAEAAPGSSGAQAAAEAAAPDQQQPSGAAAAGVATAGAAGAEGASAYRCYLLHLARLGDTGVKRMPRRLKQLLEHKQVVLATVGDRDEVKLSVDLGVDPSRLQQVNELHFVYQDLKREAEEAAAAGGKSKSSKKARRQAQRLAQQHKAPRENFRMLCSLDFLSWTYVGKNVDKSCQKNNSWEKAELSPKCMRYAATDAYAQLLVYKEIKARLKPLTAGSS